jgi:hypothetical protein
MGNGVVELITQMKESLEREIHAFRDEMRTRFDAQAARMERQGGLLRSGQTNLVRLNDWSEKIDQLLEERDKRLEALEERVRKLEGGAR